MLAILAVSCALSTAGRRLTAAEAPEKETRTLQAALQDLRSRYFDRRREALQTIIEAGRRRPDAVGETLMPLLEDDDLRTRLLVARALGEIHYAPALDAMADLLFRRETSPLERTTLLEAFVKYDREAEEYIFRIGADDDPLGRMIIGRIAMPAVVEYIDSFFLEGDQTGWFRGQFDGLKHRGKAAVYALMLIVESYFVTPEPDYLAKRAANYRWLALHGLGEFGDPVAVPLLKRVIRDIEEALELKEYSPENKESARQDAIRCASIACWNCGEREPLIRYIHTLREKIDLETSQYHPTRYVFGQGIDQRADEIAVLYWNLAISLSTLDLVDEVVESYRQYVRWKKKAYARVTDDGQEWAVGFYNIACTYARAERPDEGIQALFRAVEEGYQDTEWAQKDGDLENVRARPAFDLAIAYAHVMRMKQSWEIPVIRERSRRKALRWVRRAVDRDLRDPAWLEDPACRRRFAPLSRDPAFHWNAARFYARAGLPEKCASRLRDALEADARRKETRPPGDGEPAVDLAKILSATDFSAVRDHPAVRDLLREQGLIGEEGD